jgi:hypothetical protein
VGKILLLPSRNTSHGQREMSPVLTQLLIMRYERSDNWKTRFFFDSRKNLFGREHAHS